MLWDTAGQERFSSLIPGYVRDSHVVIVVYDITNYNSFYNVNSWIKIVRNERGTKALIIVAGNKTDLKDRREVTVEDAMQKCCDLEVLFMEVSAHNGHNIDALFRCAASNI